jgi:hypothetical protein
MEPQQPTAVAAQVKESIVTPASPTQIAAATIQDTLRGVMPLRVADASAPIAPATPVAIPADLLDDGRIRAAVDDFVRGIRARATTNFDLSEFYAEGAEHSVTLHDAPSPATPTASSTRVAIELAITKRDAVGRRFSRRLPVAMTVANRDGRLHVSAVAFGALRKP